MPTIRNDRADGQAVSIEGTDGIKRPLLPGHSVETYQTCTESFLTQTADTPVKKPYTLLIVTNSGGADQTVEADIGSGVDKVRVQVLTDGITVVIYKQTTTDNVPITPPGGLTSAHGFWSFDIERTADKLQCIFSNDGSMEVRVF